MVGWMGWMERDDLMDGMKWDGRMKWDGQMKLDIFMDGLDGMGWDDWMDGMEWDS